MGCLWNFHDVSMIFLEDFYGVSERVLWKFYGILWDSYGISLWFLCYFHVISMIFLWDFCGVPMGFPCYFYEIPMGFKRIPMVLL